MDNGGAVVAKTSKALALPSPETILAEFEQERSSPTLLELIRLADRGYARALSTLRDVYAALPALAQTVSTWQYATELEILGTTQPGITETFAEQAKHLRKQLAGDRPSP